MHRVCMHSPLVVTVCLLASTGISMPFRTSFLLASGVSEVRPTSGPNAAAASPAQWSPQYSFVGNGADSSARWPAPPNGTTGTMPATAPQPELLRQAQAPPAKISTSAKTGVKERQYSLEQLRLGAHSILKSAKRGKPLAAATAATAQGAPSMRSALARLMWCGRALGLAGSFTDQRPYSGRTRQILHESPLGSPGVGAKHRQRLLLQFGAALCTRELTRQRCGVCCKRRAGERARARLGGSA